MKNTIVWPHNDFEGIKRDAASHIPPPVPNKFSIWLLPLVYFDILAPSYVHRKPGMSLVIYALTMEYAKNKQKKSAKSKQTHHPVIPSAFLLRLENPLTAEVTPPKADFPYLS